MVRNVHIRQTQTQRLPGTLCETAVLLCKHHADERPSAGATKDARSTSRHHIRSHRTAAVLAVRPPLTASACLGLRFPSARPTAPATPVPRTARRSTNDLATSFRRATRGLAPRRIPARRRSLLPPRQPTVPP